MQSLTNRMKQVFDLVATHASSSSNELPEEKYEQVIQVPGLLAQLRASCQGITTDDIYSLGLDDPTILSDREFEVGLLVYDLLQFNGLLPLEQLPRTLACAEFSGTKQLIDELTTACIYGDTVVIQSLAARIGTNIVDHHFQTPLMYAIGNYRHEAVVLLVNLGADINLITPAGNTAMHCAASGNCSFSTFEYLACHGGKLDIKDFQERTPIEVLELNERKDWIKRLDNL